MMAALRRTSPRNTQYSTLSNPPANSVTAPRNAVSSRQITETTFSSNGVEISSMPQSTMPAPMLTAVIISVKSRRYPSRSSRGTDRVLNALGLNRYQ